LGTPVAAADNREVAAGASDRAEVGARRERRRVGAALVAATVAFVAAVLAAMGPANPTANVYRWPAPARAASSLRTSDAGGGRMLFAPLLLSRHQPARVSVDVPCAVVESALAANGGRVTVLQTARDVATRGGLSLVVAGERMRLGVGRAVLAEGAWPGPAPAHPGCVVSAAFRGERWRLAIGSEEVGRGRSSAPVVTGLFSELPRPVVAGAGVSVRVVTEVAGSSPSARQVAFTVVAVGAGVAALVLLLRGSRRRCRRRARVDRPVREAMRRFMFVDALVVVALSAWWIFGPVFYDDGWELSTAANFSESGAFSNYYSFFDSQYPLGFLHFLFNFGSSLVSTTLLWMRLPGLLMGVAIWVLLRMYLAALGRAGKEARVALASMFLLFWFAWLSSLRFEPKVALLSVIVLIALQRFHQTAGLGALATAVLAAMVALSVHAEGVVVLAPLLVAIPTVYRWARERHAMGALTLVALALIAAAGLVLLFTADTDLAHFRDNRRTFAANELNAYTWRDEFLRYKWLFEPGFYSPVVRRATVLFALMAMALFFTRPSRRRDDRADLPAMSLVVGAALIALTPSKWPWHFGALGGFAALAVAVELRRLGLETRGGKSRNRRSLLVLAATVVASAIVWRGGAFFGDFSVLEVKFGRGGAGLSGMDLSSPMPWVVVGVGALVACGCVAALMGRFSVRAAVDRWLALSGAWAVPVAVGVVVVATLGLFVTDAFASSPGWSLARQNYEDLMGQTCGLADDVEVADPFKGTALGADPLPAQSAAAAALPEVTQGSGLDFTAAGSPPPPLDVDLDMRWGSRISGDQDTGVFVSPWFVTGPDATTAGVDQTGLVLFTAGKPDSAGNLVLVQFGRRDGPAIQPLGVERVAASNSDATWQPSALEPPAHADRLRIVAVDAASGRDGWLAFSAPHRVRYQRLESVLARPGTITFVGPGIRFYFPCVTNAVIQGGVADAPDYVATGATDLGAGSWPTSPIAGTVDLYPSHRLVVRATNETIARDLYIERIVKRPAPGVPTPFDR
jgi:arabinosyltransferase C